MPQRITMSAKDIEAIYGCSARTAYRIITKIRKEQKIKPGQKITAHQYAAFYNLDPIQIISAINYTNKGGIN